jgi:pilus assembly protein CpaF
VRIHAVLPPISQGGAVLSIRLPRRQRLSVEDLDDAGFFDAVGLDALRAVVRARTNILISGSSGSGKTTLLGALLSLADRRERLVVLEDVSELQIAHAQVTVLQSRQANLEGTGRVGLDALVREALRMRPDRLIVGECRGAEVRELLTALNTGHDGGAGTLHANSLADVPARLEALGALAGMSERALARQAVSAIGLVIHCGRVDGQRRILQCGRLTVKRSRLGIEPVHGHDPSR